MLGHKSEAVTEIYARLGEDETKRAVDMLGSLVSELRGESVELSDQDALEAEGEALRARLREIESARQAPSSAVET